MGEQGQAIKNDWTMAKQYFEGLVRDFEVYDQNHGGMTGKSKYESANHAADAAKGDELQQYIAQIAAAALAKEEKHDEIAASIFVTTQKKTDDMAVILKSLQHTVAKLTLNACEAELNAAVLCAQDMIYGKNLLESVGLKVQLPMVLQMDNKGAVDLINNFSVGGRTRHIDVKQCFLRELKESKQLIVNWIPGSENNADMFTKNLDGPIFKKYAELLLGENALEGKGGANV